MSKTDNNTIKVQNIIFYGSYNYVNYNLTIFDYMQQICNKSKGELKNSRKKRKDRSNIILEIKSGNI